MISPIHLSNGMRHQGPRHLIRQYPDKLGQSGRCATHLAAFLALLVLVNTAQGARRVQDPSDWTFEDVLPAEEVSALKVIKAVNFQAWSWGPTESWTSEDANMGLGVEGVEYEAENDANGNFLGYSLKKLGHVTGLDLSNSGLLGTLTNEIGNLSKLALLDLSNNELSGAIPDSIGNLSSLHLLYLGNNKLSGAIPFSIGNLSNLQSLDLALNELSGGIPSSIGNLSNLKYLYLGGNLLTGSIPTSIGDLVQMESLSCEQNQLTGTIPSSISNLARLIFLDLHSNMVSGEIPNSIGSLTNLEYLDLRDNNISGTIPSSIGNLTKLKTLFLGGCPFTGTIPNTIGALSSLEYLSISNTYLSGAIPGELAGLSNLREITLGGNALSGVVPVDLATLPSLRYLGVEGNYYNTFQGSQFRAFIDAVSANPQCQPVWEDQAGQDGMDVSIEDLDNNTGYFPIQGLDEDIKVTNNTSFAITSQFFIDLEGQGVFVFAYDGEFVTLQPNESKVFNVKSSFVKELPIVAAGGLGNYKFKAYFGGAPPTDIGFAVLRTTSVKVIDAVTKLPIEGATATLFSTFRDNAALFSTTTNSTGEIPNPPGPHGILADSVCWWEATAEGYAVNPEKSQFPVNLNTSTNSVIELTPIADAIINANFANGNVPAIRANGFNAGGRSLNPLLSFPPNSSTDLTVIDNTSSEPIAGFFTDLSQGQLVSLTFNGTQYNFFADYFGGDGNDLVLVTSPIELDIDGDGQVKTFVDGFLVVRFMLGLTGSDLTANISSAGSRLNGSEIQAYLSQMKADGQFDIDGDGTTKTFTDGFLLLRRLLGLGGSDLVNGITLTGATRNASQMEQVVDDLKKNPLLP